MIKNCLNCKHHLPKWTGKSVEPYCAIGNLDEFRKFWNSMGFKTKKPIETKCCEPFIKESNVINQV